MSISNLFERVFGPRTILAQPGYDPTLESRRRTAADFGRGKLPIGKLLFFGVSAVLLGISIWKMTAGAPQAAAAPGPTATASQIGSATTSPTPLPSTTPSRTPIPSRTPYGTPFGQKPAGAVASHTPVANWGVVTQHALETMAYAPTGTPVVIIEYRGGGAAEPLPTYTPYPTLAPLQALPTYTPLPTYTIVLTEAPTGTQEPTATYTPPPTPTAAPMNVPPAPYRVYLPLVGQ